IGQDSVGGFLGRDDAGEASTACERRHRMVIRQARELDLALRGFSDADAEMAPVGGVQGELKNLIEGQRGTGCSLLTSHWIARVVEYPADRVAVLIRSRRHTRRVDVENLK